MTRRLAQLLIMASVCLSAANAPAQEDAEETVAGHDAMEPAVSGKALEEAVRPPAEAPAERPAAMDTLDLRRTEITGNQELPKVLYIVPWQKSDPGNLLGRPVNTLLDEVLAPIDREEFIRQVDYYSDLNGNDLNGPQDE